MAFLSRIENISNKNDRIYKDGRIPNMQIRSGWVTQEVKHQVSTN